MDEARSGHELRHSWKAAALALIASSISRHEYNIVKEIANFVLRIGLLTSICLTAILGASFGSLATLFTRDLEVLQVVGTGVLFVSASQPFNALAYIFYGLHYGVSDFLYAAFSMMVVGAISLAFLPFAPSLFVVRGVWLGLTLFMAFHSVASFVRLLSKNGPWWFFYTGIYKLHRLELSKSLASHKQQGIKEAAGNEMLDLRLAK